MKTNEMLRYLKKKGCYIERHGGNHDIWKNPKTQGEAQVPRHPSKEIGTGMAHDILKKLGLK